MDELRYRHGPTQSEERLIVDALHALRKNTAIAGELVSLEPVGPGDHGADALIDLVYERGSHRYLVECKSSIDRRGQLDLVRRQFGSTEDCALLVAPYISKVLAEHCRSIGLQFIDTHGNAYLRAPGLFVLVTGEKEERKAQGFDGTRGLTSPAVLRVVFVLLSRQELVNATFKDIATHAGVSLGTANNVLDDLERRGYLVNKGKSEQRKLLERERLLDEWVINYPTTLRKKLNGRRFSAPDPSWWERVPSSSGFAWGSEVAAAKMTGYLKPATQTLYVDMKSEEPVLTDLVKRHRLKPDPSGEIEVMEKFWHWTPKTMPDIAPALLVYADLLAVLDPRTQETAHLIRERFIDVTLD